MESFYNWYLGSALTLVAILIGYQIYESITLKKTVRKIVKKYTQDLECRTSDAMRSLYAGLLLTLAGTYNDADDPKRSMFIIDAAISIDMSNNANKAMALIVDNIKILEMDIRYIATNKGLRNRFLALIFKTPYIEDKNIGRLSEMCIKACGEDCC